MKIVTDLSVDALRDDANVNVPIIGNQVGGLLRRLRCLYRHRKDMQKLRNMPDYLLRDMGIERSAVEATGTLTSLVRGGSNL
ncbi:hypothetical protein [Candidatus Rhodobacter oscarellae]|uniref:hypothetical protein n=1 Tax=Candidatus Rhodobacter oscarellae TaxID=1675527 RepID=UPI00128EC86C|nr:hypothetical protein [Candidatus Rhodobacter lobularis]